MGKTNAVNTVDEQEIAEARGSTLPDMLYDVVARAATTPIGQFVYKRIDNLLWTAEKTARWSLPQSSLILAGKVSTYAAAAVPAIGEREDAGNNISGPPLVRPLPWLFFLPALIVLRLLRLALSMGARVIGHGPVLPSTVVGFLQNKRRKMRALKYRGQRLRRISKCEQNSDGSGVSATWLERLILPLKMVVCTRPHRTIDVDSDVAHAVVFHKDHPSGTSQKRTTVSKKRNLNQREAESADDEEQASDDDSFEDAGCKELLEKYADVMDDSSFNADDLPSESDDSISHSDTDPSPKKANIEADKPQLQHNQNGGQQSTSKMENLKRSASENKNGIDTQPQSMQACSTKSINVANRSKSAAELEKGNNAQPSPADGDGNVQAAPGTSTSTPSKSIPNLSSSLENNENKPINQNISEGPAAVAAATTVQIKSPTPTVLKPMAKQSPTMSDVRSTFHQQKQAAKPVQSSSVPVAQQQQTQQQFISNGGKNRNKKPATHPMA